MPLCRIVRTRPAFVFHIYMMPRTIYKNPVQVI